MSIDQTEYSAGRLDIALNMASGPISAACSVANYLYNAANAKGELTGGDLIALRQYRVQLMRAAATLDEVIAPAKLKLVAAE